MGFRNVFGTPFLYNLHPYLVNSKKSKTNANAEVLTMKERVRPIIAL